MNPLRPAAACVRLSRVFLPALVVLAGVGTARGQTAAPANEKTAASAADDVVKLEAFSVSVSIGRYIDTTSAAAMKIAVPQLDLPFSMQGLNASFLTDVRSTRLEDSFGYVTGLNKSGTNANAFTLRGFSAAGSNLQSVQIDGLPPWGLPTPPG